MGQTVKERVEALFGSPEMGEPTPIYLIPQTEGGDADAEAMAGVPEAARSWASSTGFSAAAGAFLIAPGADGRPSAALAGIGRRPAIQRIGALPAKAPTRFTEDGPPLLWRLEGGGFDRAEAALEWALGCYRFGRYKKTPPPPLMADPMPEIGAAAKLRAVEIAASVWMGRNLVNTPTSDLGPEDLEAVAANQAERHGGEMRSVVGEALLEENFPMIHAVGRAGAQAPRLLDLTWAPQGLADDAPNIALVGKGVCFDTGGLNLKPGGSMRLMKKDMGGAAASLALARMIMTLELPVRLRLLIPAVENNVDAISFRPGDVLSSRKGLSVEIDNTDAEGRLVLADAMALADEEAPDMLIDMATLTGAARVALGAEVAPFFTADDAFAAALAQAGERARDPLWRLPLWDGYEPDLASKVADCVNSAPTGLGGSITAALFLRRFVENSKLWAHFDIFGWNPKTRPGRPEGGEATAARAIFTALEARYGGGAA